MTRFGQSCDRLQDRENNTNIIVCRNNSTVKSRIVFGYNSRLSSKIVMCTKYLKLNIVNLPYSLIRIQSVYRSL